MIILITANTECRKILRATELLHYSPSRNGTSEFFMQNFLNLSFRISGSLVDRDILLVVHIITVRKIHGDDNDDDDDDDRDDYVVTAARHSRVQSV